jgi:hypothetical protein
MAWLGDCKNGNPAIPGAGQKAKVVVAGGGARTGRVRTLFSCNRLVLYEHIGFDTIFLSRIVGKNLNMKL